MSLGLQAEGLPIYQCLSMLLVNHLLLKLRQRWGELHFPRGGVEMDTSVLALIASAHTAPVLPTIAATPPG